MADEEVPVHVAVDCGTGEVVHTPQTPREAAARLAEDAERGVRWTASARRRAEAEQTVLASTDPVVMALAVLLNLAP